MLGAFLICLPNFSLAYKKTTHNTLTQKTFEIYEELNGDKFTDVEIEKALLGSMEEDIGIRPVRHFFDPINNRGLNILGIEFMSAKEWAQNTEEQSKVGKNPSDDDKYFSNGTDFSWERAIFEYVHGDKERAVESLGHILHLVQDMTVPAHTRNDDHLNFWGEGDIELYEEFVADKQVSELADFTIPEFQNLNQVFNVSSKFTNENFLSKDTVFEGYKKPIIDYEEKVSFGILYGYKKNKTW